MKKTLVILSIAVVIIMLFANTKVTAQVLYVEKWNILPDKMEAYAKWTESAIRRTTTVPGVIEFRGYRPATGTHQVVVTYEFANLAAWAAWYTNEEIQKTRNELRTLVSDLNLELWGPSPIVLKPIRPGK
jgi:antibiotic biosynthesis monooxygenase (ABM) superfamily enzyme